MPASNLQVPLEVWVIDTSSIIEVCRGLPQTEHTRCFALLTGLARGSQLVFPSQVIGELKRYAPTKKSGQPHPPLRWALSVEQVAVSNPEWATVKEVLEKVEEVLDTEKPASVDEADPYIVARALELQREGRKVRVITEETHNRPLKLALSTAAGVLGLAAVTLLPFLKGQGFPN